MKDWELSLRLIALGHRVTSTSGFTCVRCHLTLSDILGGDRPCLVDPDAAPAPPDPAGLGHEPEGGATPGSGEGDG